MYYSIIVPISLLMLISCTNGEECDDKTRDGLAIIFCENSMKCTNSSGYELMAHMRTCMSAKSQEAKQVIESSNKLETSKCIKEIAQHVCKVLTEIKKEPNKYKECTDRFDAEEKALKSCQANDSKPSE